MRNGHALPDAQARQEIAEATKARERERELAKEIAEGDVDAEDEDFEVCEQTATRVACFVVSIDKQRIRAC